MKQIILLLLIILTSINVLAQLASFNGAIEVGTHNGYRLFAGDEKNTNLKIRYQKMFWKAYVNGTTSTFWNTVGNTNYQTYSYEINIYNSLKNINYSEVNRISTDISENGIIYFQIVKPTQPVVYACTKEPFNIILGINNGENSPIEKWERSSNKGLDWDNIECTNIKFTEDNPTYGTFLYRALKKDGTYTNIVEVIYIDAVPETINTLPITSTKTVDESITFTLEVEGDNYNYQWYKDGITIDGATTKSYTIEAIKTTHEGAYYCTVWNGCNTVDSKSSALTVNKCPQVITFDEIPIKTYGDEDFYLPEKTDKGLTITYQSTNTNVAIVEGNKVTIKNAGTSTIIASQAGDADYLLATTVGRNLIVNKQNQVISFNTIPVKTYGDPDIILPEKTDKGLIISYQSTNTQVATIDNNILTIVGAGTAEIIASQSGDDYKYSAVPVTQELIVNKSKQNITFLNFDTKTFGDKEIILNQYSDVGLEIVYTSDNEEIATIEGNIVKLKNVGIAQITANQSGNKNYLPATELSRTLIIQKANQTIVWDNIEPKTYGDNDFFLPQKTDKELIINYSSANENVVKVIDNKVQIVGAGNTTITAQQAGNSNYNPASTVTLSIVVSKAMQVITFNELEEKTYGDMDFILQATNNSGLPIVYESSDFNIIEITDNVATIKNAGEVYITASTAGNNNYYIANPQEQLLKVNKATQIIELSDISNRTYGDGDFTLQAQINTNLPIIYKSSDPAKLFISGNQAMILGAGTVTITAEQTGNNNYLPISESKTFTINKSNLIVAAENKDKFYGDDDPEFTYTLAGLVNGDTKTDIGSVFTLSTDAEINSNVGEYDITVANATHDNYTFTYRKGKLTIKKATLTVKANDVTRKYGETNPTFIIGYSGFKNNEDENILIDKPIAVTNAKTSSSVGIYDIFVSGASATNYDFEYEKGVLNIEKSILNVLTDNKERVYGDENPSLTYWFNGFKNEDSLNDLDILPSVWCNAVNNSPVGDYSISVSGASDNNYDFNYQSGKLSVKKANLAISVQNEIKYLGEDNPKFILLFDGFKNNENQSVLAQLPYINCNADKNSAVGFYDIVLSGGYDNNYDYILQNGKLEIKPKVIVKESQTIPSTLFSIIGDLIYGDYSGIGLPEKTNKGLIINYQSSNSQVAVIDGNKIALLGAGSTTITATQEGDEYYYPALPVTQNLVVNKAPLTITAQNSVKYQGEDNPDFTLLFNGFKRGENQSALDQLPTISCDADKESVVGLYDIVLSDGYDNNYNYILLNGKLEIKPIGNTSISSINPLEKTYIYPNPANDYIIVKCDTLMEKIEVYNQSGILLIEENYPTERIDVSKLKEGIYFIKIYTGAIPVTQKLIITK